MSAAEGQVSPAPPEAWGPMFRLVRLAGKPVERFLKIEAASGIVLIVAAAVAIGWANSPWSASYDRLWQTSAAVQVGTITFERTLAWVVNDVLMAIFFFVVGLEIHRELRRGELSEWRRAALPVAAAVGGMVVPAGAYLLLAGDGPARAGWGVPMATDIAFAVGVLALLGKRVPAALRVLLLALAVIDDLGAIVVIAVFYSSGISLAGLGIAGGGVAAIFALRAIGMRRPSVYFFPAIAVWAGIYKAGIHPTIAGVILGLLTPVRAWLGTEGFVAQMRGHMESMAMPKQRETTEHETSEALRQVDFARREAVSPAEFLIDSLHPWVAFVIMPVFALANAGVRPEGFSFEGAGVRVAGAVAFGLLVAKPAAVVLASFAVVRAGLASLPVGLTRRHLVVLGLVSGIGFTMSLFVAQLAFPDAELLGAAKIGVLLASALAVVLGLGVGLAILPRSQPGAAATPDEAEASTTH